jgi:cation transport ATPase
VRGPDREAAEQTGRGHGHGQLRDREGHGDYSAEVDPSELVAQVEKAGYTADLAAPTHPDSGPQPGEDDPVAPLRQRLLISLVLSAPVIAMAMVPALQFTYWQWLSLTLAAPVVAYGAWPFHRAAWTNLRHGTSTMDTLISMGTLAALGWSLYALFFGTAGEPGMTHPFELIIARMDGAADIYLEAAAGVTTFILAGRHFEARSKRRAGAALRALLEMGAKDVAVLRLAGALEDASEHPVAKAVATGARERVGTLPAVEGFQNTEGLGVTGVVDGQGWGGACQRCCSSADMVAISASCTSMIWRASSCTSGFCPDSSTVSDMVTAPWWCSIIICRNIVSNSGPESCSSRCI